MKASTSSYNRRQKETLVHGSLLARSQRSAEVPRLPREF
uniref:Uncharacterized protein n=1 Tax=Anguilla anguilla TaxID=7936 RepID=A0A0E9WP83_ANGAN